MSKLAVIGASYLQMPLIVKAQQMGCEVHAFAWECGDVGESAADVFHPISITEFDDILEECRRIGVDGVATIASDLAAVTVGHVAHGLGLACNPPECVAVTTNKSLMRKALAAAGCPSPASVAVSSPEEAHSHAASLRFPLIVKPADRSGSRGVTKLERPDGLEQAVAHALEQSFNNTAMVEECLVGREYSVEFISWQARHMPLAITRKFTTGAPSFIETGHMQPVDLDVATSERIFGVVRGALDALGVEVGASHTEVMVGDDGSIGIIEVAARMGGDFIGSDLVQLSRGYDFVAGIIECALGEAPQAAPSPTSAGTGRAAGVRFVFDQRDIDVLEHLKRYHPEAIAHADIPVAVDHEVTDSSNRSGYAVFSSNDHDLVLRYLNAHDAGQL